MAKKHLKKSNKVGNEKKLNEDVLNSFRRG